MLKISADLHIWKPCTSTFSPAVNTKRLRIRAQSPNSGAMTTRLRFMRPRSIGPRSISPIG
jgi:hypothetical protein